jgi:hypothetical protein
MPDTTFKCPNCGVQYKVVRVETPPTHDNALRCLGCGGPLQNREGGFALKYFRTDDGLERVPRNGYRPRF